MADLNITGQNTSIDANRWKKLTPQEIIKEEGDGEEIPAEILQWAQQMAAFSKIPDDVTYDKVDGDTGIEALEKLGITPEDEVAEVDENAAAPVETEEEDAVQDAAKTEELPGEEEEKDEDILAEEKQAAPAAAPEAPEEADTENDEDVTLADNKITTNNEEILKRRRKKGEAEG